MVEKNEISFLPLSPEEAIRMHSYGYDFKKRGAFIRMRFRKWSGRKVPEYGIQPGRFPVSRWLMEAVISFLFSIMSFRPARWLSEKMPPESLCRIFEAARRLWKKIHQVLRRINLCSLDKCEFRIYCTGFVLYGFLIKRLYFRIHQMALNPSFHLIFFPSS